MCPPIHSQKITEMNASVLFNHRVAILKVSIWNLTAVPIDNRS
jgi:hypothetical protein